MGCTISTDGSDPPSKKNKISDMKCDKPLNKYDLIRIEMVLEYWYDEEPWSDSKNNYFRSQLEQMDTYKQSKETGAESSQDNKTSSSQISKETGKEGE